MRISRSAGIAGAILITAFGWLPPCAAAPSAEGSPVIVVPGKEHYVAAPIPFPAGTMIAVLSGDPSAAGIPYTIRIKLPDGARLPVHIHDGIENVTVVSGTFLVGVGKVFDSSKMLALAPGAYVSVPAKLPHYAMAKGPVVVDVSGIGPQTTTAIN